ncbi:MAG TPA: ABC transporter ATP-binding protein [Terrimicrobiaceae bacterium]|nr:ABC transporter ATP-binding protein [Terrimicrobiaceae bacterium]
MNAIELRGLTKIFRTYRKEKGVLGAVKGLFRREYQETRAVDGIGFSIAEGEFVGFLGPNGAGKTTTLKMLSGLLHPTGGQASVLGFVPWERKDAMKRQMSLLMGQKNALWWDLPARESLELNRAIYDIPRADFDRSVGELTEMLDVREQLDVMVRELSLGQRMKMELIAALLHRPKVLFLDEPTIGLDVVSQKTVREFLKEHNARSRTTIMLTSHYMQDIEALCERVILIDHGKVMFDGPLEQIVERFAGNKIVEAKFDAPTAADFSHLGQVLEQKPDSVRVEVPRAKVADVCRAVLESAAVVDLTVSEPPIEEIIRDVFGKKPPA